MNQDVNGSVADPGQYFPDPDHGLQEKPDPDPHPDPDPCEISPHELMNFKNNVNFINDLVNILKKKYFSTGFR